MKKRFIPLVVVAAVLVLLGTGCSSKEKAPPPDIVDTLQKAIMEEVEDPERAREATALLEQVNAGLDNYVRMTMENRAIFRDLNREWPFDEAAYREFYGVLREERVFYQESLLDLDMALRDIVTEKEWKKIQKKLADRITRYYLGIPEERA